MDKITKSEYRILRACARKPCDLSDVEADNLYNIHYIDIDFSRSGSKPEHKCYYITHAGRLAYEHYHNYVFEQRMVSLRAWIALGLSGVSIIISIISLLNGR